MEILKIKRRIKRAERRIRAGRSLRAEKHGKVDEYQVKARLEERLEELEAEEGPE